MTIVNYASSSVNKLKASLNDDTRVIIYDRHMYIVQATGGQSSNLYLNVVHLWQLKTAQLCLIHAVLLKTKQYFSSNIFMADKTQSGKWRIASVCRTQFCHSLERDTC